MLSCGGDVCLSVCVCERERERVRECVFEEACVCMRVGECECESVCFESSGRMRAVRALEW